MNDVKARETICANCEHGYVCQYKDNYLSIYECVTKALRNYNTEFLKPVEPMCKYYKKNEPSIRGGGTTLHRYA